MKMSAHEYVLCIPTVNGEIRGMPKPAPLTLALDARMVGMHKADFMDELGRRKVSVINWDEVEIRREFGPHDA